ncbi:copper resistance D family protein [Zavarzinia sp. CC-PAN008]|uniref:copper resistance D family protein n=1 Tax=Zavarzinia sp. CC-PAN008 TaxID=3243332 RepID=UPI003F7430ED
MELLLDIFGFLTIVLRGFDLVAQSMAVGGIVFIAVIAQPLQGRLGVSGAALLDRSYRLLVLAGIGLAAFNGARILLQLGALFGTIDLDWEEALGAHFVTAWGVRAACGVAIAALAASRVEGRLWLLVLFTAILLLAGILTSHSIARLDDRAILAAATLVHQVGAAIWIGGLPWFIAGLARAQDGRQTEAIGRRYSLLSLLGVALILAAAAPMVWLYIGSVPALYGTAYGVMVGAKSGLMIGLLFLGAGNFFMIRRLARDPGLPTLRLRRFAEIEFGIGITILFGAASLTSAPPAIDLTYDRATGTEIIERITPRWPTLESPDHADLAIPALQAELDRQAAEARAQAPQAFVPGAGFAPPRNAQDIAWSEYNHHWAGILVLAIGLLALAQASGKVPIARHWPLLFLVLAAFLFVRSDPEVWPLGDIGFWESFRDSEVVQHRVVVFLVVALGLFEWSVQTGRLPQRPYGEVIPMMIAVGATLLLVHSHAVANIKEQLLIEITHIPLALAGVAAGWARWLQIRLDPPGNRIAGYVWPSCFVLIGLLLLAYRES